MVIWSLVLATTGILGLWFAGRKQKIGWAIGFCTQILWIIFAVTTGTWGFLLSAVAYGFVYGRNWLRWRREEKSDEDLRISSR